MLHTRISTPGDIPRQRELWQLAFGDSGAHAGGGRRHPGYDRLV